MRVAARTQYAQPLRKPAPIKIAPPPTTLAVANGGKSVSSAIVGKTTNGVAPAKGGVTDDDEVRVRVSVGARLVI